MHILTGKSTNFHEGTSMCNINKRTDCQLLQLRNECPIQKGAKKQWSHARFIPIPNVFARKDNL